MSQLQFARLAWLAIAWFCASLIDAAEPVQLVGYTELQTNVPGGRHANVRTMRAKVVAVDGSGDRLLAPELADKADAWTQFAGWSPDGKTAIVGRGWESPENAAWEEEHKTFRFTPEGWRVDSYLVDVASGRATNVTAVDEVSFYSSGVFYWPNDPTRLGFTALIDGNSHPFRMDLDGRNKVDLTKGSNEFAYGFSSSRDGTRICYHKSYRIYLANADGSNAVQVETGQPFNFVPTWSPDGQWVLFLSGEHYNCHPHIVRADGTGLKKLADRGGYRGVVEFLDVPDFHGGSSDTPAWSPDGQSVFFTALVGKSVELFRVSLAGQVDRLTHSPDGVLHYHPQPSADGKQLLYGSKRHGVRNVYALDLVTGQERPLTSVSAGRAAFWPHWQPAPHSTSPTASGRASIPIANPKRLAAAAIPCERVPLGEGDDYKPCVARLPDGELLLTAFHQHKREGDRVLEQTLLFRSRDGGRTWSPPQPLDLLGREPYLSVLADGTIFLTGHLLANDVRNEWGYTCGFIHRSTDRGKTWHTTRIESEAIKPGASNHSTRNVLQLADGTLLVGVDYDGGGGPYFTWRSTDNGKTWDKSGVCEPQDFKSIYGFFGGETWLWQSAGGRVWALVRVDSNELPIKDRPIKAGNDQADHFILFYSDNQGRTFHRDRDFGDYGEMYMSLLRLQDKRLLLTFTVRDLQPPLGVRALIGEESPDGFAFDFARDRLLLDAATPIGMAQGGGFGPTVQLDDGTLVTSYSYRGEDDKTHLEVVRWQAPENQP